MVVYPQSNLTLLEIIIYPTISTHYITLGVRSKD